MKTARSLSLVDLELLESICVRLENAETDDDRNIELLLKDVSESARPHFIEELVALDLELRQQRGEKPLESDYRSFSNKSDGDVAKLVFQNFIKSENQDTDSCQSGANSTLAGRYRTVREIGRGGIGSVWRVEDMRSQRPLALKMLRNELRNNRQANIRLEREALLTGSLQHPGIPPVHDFGKLSDDSSFFVMKLVDGQTLDEILQQHDEEHRLSGRLIIFEQVAQALAYVHTQGVIHRDLKPQNIMVGRFGEVQLMDWGMAKCLNSPTSDDRPSTKTTNNGQLAAETVSSSRESSIELEAGLTRAGDLLGTPSYMAPEQARGEVDQLDARTDVFGLGAILFEILTSSRMHDQISVTEVISKIAKGDLQDAFAKLEASDVDAKLIGLCKRCLAFEQDDRPQHAGEIANELNEHFANAQQRIRTAEIELREAEVRAREETKRRKTFARMLVLLACVFAAGLAGVTWQWNKATTAGELAAKNAADFKEAAELAEKNANNYKQGLTVFASAFHSANPISGGAKLDMSAKDVLLKAKESLDKSSLDSEGKRRMFWRLGKSFSGLGEYDLAIELFEKTLQLMHADFDDDHPDKRDLMKDLAVGYSDAGRTKDAIRMGEQVLVLVRAKLGADHTDTLSMLNSLASFYRVSGQAGKSVELQEQTLELTKIKLGIDHIQTIRLMNNLANSYADAGRIAEAINMGEKTLTLMKAELGPDHNYTLSVMSNLAASYMGLGQTDKAIELSEKTLERQQAKLGSNHRNTLFTMGNLTATYNRAGRLDEAIEMGEQTLELMKNELGPDHPNTLISMSNLAGIYRDAARADKAVEIGEQTLELMHAKLPPDHPYVLATMANLVASYVIVGLTDKAIELGEQTVKRMTACQPLDHPNTISAMSSLAIGYYSAARTEEAIQLHEQILEARKTKLGPDHPDTFHSMKNLVTAVAINKGFESKLTNELMAEFRAFCDSTETGELLQILAAAEFRIGNFDQAVAAAEASIEMMQPSPHPINYAILAMSHFELRNVDMAEEFRARLEQAMEAEEFTSDKDCLKFAEEVVALFEKDSG